jgi:uncharacterized Zn finger protein
MKAVHDMVDKSYVEAHATPSTVRLGKELAAAGRVEIIASEPSVVEAAVVGDTKRRVIMSATPTGVAWECTCSKDRTRLCKHAVAVASVLN